MIYYNNIINGILIDKYINLVKQCRIESIQITLDGTKTVYEATKNYIDINNAFEKILDNIFLLTKNDIHVSIRMNVSRNNIEDLKLLCRQLLSDRRWNDKISIYFYPLIDYIKTFDEYLDTSEYEEMFSSLYRNMFDCGYYTSAKQFRLKPRTLSCYGWDLTTFAIGLDGELYNCQHELGQPDHIIGDVRTGMYITKIWWKIILASFRLTAGIVNSFRFVKVGAIMQSKLEMLICNVRQ